MPPLPDRSTRSTRSARQRQRPAREAILAATRDLLLQHGARAVSIRRVAERSGYSAPTIYHHFGDKSGLVDTVLDGHFAEALAVMRAVPQGQDTARYLRELALAFFRFAVENPDHYRLLAVPRERDDDLLPSAEAARELVKRALAQLAVDGSLASPDVEAAFQVTWAVLHGLISLHIDRPEVEPSRNLVDLAFDMVEQGLLRREVLP